MNKQTVLVTDYVFADFDQERKILAEVGAELKITQCKTIADLKPHLAGVHGLLNTYLATCDAIFVQCPSSKATRHLLDRTAFGKMSRQPLVINCARGEVVDTDALVWALQNGKVSGAGLDVLEDESIVKTQHPLKECPNVTISPPRARRARAADVGPPHRRRPPRRHRTTKGIANTRTTLRR
jgi:phosphoglycerate dehydrogenase-like enzyme